MFSDSRGNLKMACSSRNMSKGGANYDYLSGGGQQFFSA
jgi:hypothetical protein